MPSTRSRVDRDITAGHRANSAALHAEANAIPDSVADESPEFRAVSKVDTRLLAGLVRIAQRHGSPTLVEHLMPLERDVARTLARERKRVKVTMALTARRKVSAGV